MAQPVVKDFDWELISEVGKHSIIYVPEHEDYRNCKKRHTAWEKIGKNLDIHPFICRKRWGSMKTNFVKYTLGIQEGKRRTLPYYDQLRQLLENGEEFARNHALLDGSTTNSEDTSYQVCSTTMEQDAIVEYGNCVESTINEQIHEEEMNASEENQMINAKLENIDLTMDDDNISLDEKSGNLLSMHHDNSVMSYTMHSQVTTNRINNSHSHNHSEQEIVYEDVSTTQPPPPPPPAPQQPSQVQRSHNYNAYTNAVLEEDECLIAGKRIGFQLKSVEDFQRTIAEKLISDIVYFAKMGNLTEHSTVVCNSHNSH